MEQQPNPYQKTEKILYNYDKFKKSIIFKKEQINELQQSGIHKRSKSVIRWVATSGGVGDKMTDNEIVEKRINEIESEIAVIQSYLNRVDEALKVISLDPYYSVIQMIYFKHYTIEKTSEMLDKDISTTFRNRKRLINEMSIHLFGDEILDNIFN